jgi:hypothetical protein
MTCLARQIGWPVFPEAKASGTTRHPLWRWATDLMYASRRTYCSVTTVQRLPGSGKGCG